MTFDRHLTLLGGININYYWCRTLGLIVFSSISTWFYPSDADTDVRFFSTEAMEVLSLA